LEDNIKKLRWKISSLESEASTTTQELTDHDDLYQQELEKANHDNLKLSKEVGQLKSELLEVKSREAEASILILDLKN
jgi:predicted  nucleic acid-binding Zn-ribbon protein